MICVGSISSICGQYVFLFVNGSKDLAKLSEKLHFPLKLNSCTGKLIWKGALELVVLCKTLLCSICS